MSPSLLENITIGPVPARFSFGMEEWIEPYFRSTSSRSSSSSTLVDKARPQTGPKSNEPLQLQPHPQRLPTTLQPHPQDYRYEPPTKKNRFFALSEEELEGLSKPCIPNTTKNSTKWALENFKSWLSSRKSTNSSDKCPESLLEDMDSAKLNKWLSVFVAETRKVNGEPYPPATLQLLLSGLQRHLRSLNLEKAPNIFAKNDPAFNKLHHTMDSVYKKLRASGVGAQRRPTETFTKEEENKLWECGVLGIDNPISLLRAVFFYNGKIFA